MRDLVAPWAHAGATLLEDSVAVAIILADGEVFRLLGINGAGALSTSGCGTVLLLQINLKSASRTSTVDD